jgi:SRSO17 transposase
VRRLELLRQALGETPSIFYIDATGDRKKGHTTDVAHQHIGNLHTLAKGVVSVNAYGVTFPLAFSLYKPKLRLKEGDVSKCKPQLAIELIQDLAARGFHFSVVLADSLYGERSDFTALVKSLGRAICGRPPLQSGRQEGQGGSGNARRASASSTARSVRRDPTALPPGIALWSPDAGALLLYHYRSSPAAARDHLDAHDHAR